MSASRNSISRKFGSVNVGKGLEAALRCTWHEGSVWAETDLSVLSEERFAIYSQWLSRLAVFFERSRNGSRKTLWISTRLKRHTVNSANDYSLSSIGLITIEWSDIRAT